MFFINSEESIDIVVNYDFLNITFNCNDSDFFKVLKRKLDLFPQYIKIKKVSHLFFERIDTVISTIYDSKSVKIDLDNSMSLFIPFTISISEYNKLIFNLRESLQCWLKNEYVLYYTEKTKQVIF